MIGNFIACLLTLALLSLPPSPPPSRQFPSADHFGSALTQLSFYALTVSNPIYNRIRKYLGISLTKEVKDLHMKNCKMLLREMKDPNKWKDIWVCRSEDLILSRCQHYRGNPLIQWNPCQNSYSVFHRNRKMHPKSHVEVLGTLKPRLSWKRTIELEVAHFLISKMITKLQ